MVGCPVPTDSLFAEVARITPYVDIWSVDLPRLGAFGRLGQNVAKLVTCKNLAPLQYGNMAMYEDGWTVWLLGGGLFPLESLT